MDRLHGDHHSILMDMILSWIRIAATTKKLLDLQSQEELPKRGATRMTENMMHPWSTLKD
jgi:hypothetical protein